MKFSNHQNTLHRNERLAKCARIAGAILGLSHEQLSRLVCELHDERGTLTVTWRDIPTEAGKAAWSIAWAECGEKTTVHTTNIS